MLGELHLFYRRQEIAVCRHDVLGVDDIGVRVFQTELFHNLIVFPKRLLIILGRTTWLLCLSFPYPQYYHNFTSRDDFYYVGRFLTIRILSVYRS